MFLIGCFHIGVKNIVNYVKKILIGFCLHMCGNVLEVIPAVLSHSIDMINVTASIAFIQILLQRRNFWGKVTYARTHEPDKKGVWFCIETSFGMWTDVESSMSEDASTLALQVCTGLLCLIGWFVWKIWKLSINCVFSHSFAKGATSSGATYVWLFLTNKNKANISRISH